MEVPPPSKFNRRVPEALDRLVARALARDLDGRYGSAKQLADELYALLEGYRFQTGELSEFLRGLFRQDWAREREEVDACMKSFVGASSPGGPGFRSALSREESAPELIPLDPTGATNAAGEPGGVSSPNVDETPPEQPPPAGEPRGLWARIKGKLGK